MTANERREFDCHSVNVAIKLGSRNFLDDIRRDLAEHSILEAIGRRDTSALFDWIVSRLSLQGISDRAALTFDARNGGVHWIEIETALQVGGLCPKLQSYWSFGQCGYRKNGTCSEPGRLPQCPLPKHQLRKGSLNQASYSLFLFLRDVCDGDLVGWIDSRLKSVAQHAPGFARSLAIREALIEPLTRIYGVGDKLWSMILADVLLARDPGRSSWVKAGASMIAIDSLVHNFLHRTGILRQLDAMHAYGPRCYATGGCADIIEAFASDFDARTVNSQFPKYFPRFIQHAIWAFCSEGGWGICNGRKIDDRSACEQNTCPAFNACERVPLHGLKFN